MLQYEMVGEKDTPEWLKKCMCCTHAYVRRDEDLEVRCRCRKGCNSKQNPKAPIYKTTV